MSHPAFRVEIDVTHHYQQTNVGAEAPAPDGAEVIALASGKAVRKLVPHDYPYFVDFGAGAIDAIIAGRKAAKDREAEISAANATKHPKDHEHFSPISAKPFGMLVAEHIQTAAMPAHSPMEHWEAVRVTAPEGFDELLKAEYGMTRTLEEYLQFYFDLPGEGA